MMTTMMRNSSNIPRRFCVRHVAVAVVLLCLIPPTVAFRIYRVDHGSKPWSTMIPILINKGATSHREKHGFRLMYQSGGSGESITTTQPFSTTTSTSETGSIKRDDPTTASRTTTTTTTTRRRSLSNKTKIQVVAAKNKTNKESVSTLRSPEMKTALIPLSPNPRLFVSSSPILTPQECEILSKWCRDVEKRGESIEDLLRGRSTPQNITSNLNLHHHDSHGIQVMKKLQRLVHHSVLGMDRSNVVGDEDDYVVPRFLHYQSSAETTNDDWKSATVDQLIPDGLHVDTNNNKHFRHWTILVYLDSTESPSLGGATTFPLAERYSKDSLPSTSCRPMSFSSSSLEALSLAKQAATELIYKDNVQHTRIEKENLRVMQLGQCLEDAALRLYQEDAHHAHAQCQGEYPPGPSSSFFLDQTTMSQQHGIRILPRQGHICLFSGVKHDGYPNPFSFHAGEAILAPGGSKDVLTFFYEIPTHLFASRAEFGEQVRQREEDFLKFHGLSSSL